MITIHQVVRCHYTAVLTRTDALALLDQAGMDVPENAITDEQLTALLITTAANDDELHDHLVDMAYETDSGNDPWEA